MEAKAIGAGLSARGPAWAKIALKDAAAVCRAGTRRLLGRPAPRILLVLGHMRSGSTLLHHILASHPRIAGRGERNRPYRRPLDFERLVVDVELGTGRGLGLRADGELYFLDQVNHDRFTPRPELLAAPRLRKIFLVRRPGTALASMQDVLGEHYRFGLGDAVEHYTTRLAGLAELARLDRPERQFFLTYEELTGPARGGVLGRLADFLELPGSLEQSYRRFDFTGRRGDPSPAIRAGRIVENRRREAELEAPVRERVENAFSRARDVLRACCQTTPTES